MWNIGDYKPSIIEDLLQKVSSKIFSMIDLEKEPYLIPTVRKDIPKTAITTTFFKFNRASMDHQNSAQSFQRTIDQLLRNCPFMRWYLDSIFKAPASWARIKWNTFATPSLQGVPDHLHTKSKPQKTFQGQRQTSSFVDSWDWAISIDVTLHRLLAN